MRRGAVPAVGLASSCTENGRLTCSTALLSLSRRATRSPVHDPHLPLSKPNPSSRNIPVPQSMHEKFKNDAHLPAEKLKKRAQKALLLRMQQEVLWRQTVINTPDNSLVQHFSKLFRNAKYRSTRRMTVVGGREMIRELCEAGHPPRHLLVTEGKEIPEWAFVEEDTQIVTVTRQVAEECAPGNDGYVGDFELPPPPPKEQLIANKHRLERVLVLDNVDDPGQLGTLLRTAVGLQYDSVIVMNHCADLYDHRVLRAARGVHFASGVPIYTLRDEDGDDVYGMLNHIIERNNLAPVCYAGRDDVMGPASGRPESTVTTAEFQSSVVGASPVKLPAARHDTHTPASPSPRQQELGQFCLDHFASLGRGGGGDEKKEQGYMLVAGPNHKRNMLRRLGERVRRPTTQLLLDDPSDTASPLRTTDSLVALSVVMHALRPAGNWDYLPPSRREDASSPTLQTKFASVDIGANRLSVTHHDLNLDEEEQYREANARNEMAKWRRLYKRQHFSDYDYWVNAETERVAEMQRRIRKRQQQPWTAPEEGEAEAPLRAKGSQGGGMPEWVPNIVDEYRRSPDREFLMEEREKSQNYVRPSNYDR